MPPSKLGAASKLGTAKRLVLQAVVLAAMISGVSAFVSFGKTIQLSVDGHTSRIHTFATSVSGVLARQGLSIGEHDTVVPDLEDPISDGGRIAVRFGRPIDLNLDGSSNRVWVTATSVQEALDELGLREGNIFVSASRSEPIGRAGLALQVLTPRQVTVVVDGRTRQLNTSAATVRALLIEAGIPLDPADEVNPALDTVPRDGATIRVVRIQSQQLTIKVDLPFATRTIKDPAMFSWERKVVTPGVKGLKEVTVQLLRRDGKAASRSTVSELVLRAPATEVVRVGTRSTRYALTGAERLNWAALARCESGRNPHAINGGDGYYGLYQFSPGTWHAVGGHGVASKASQAEQTYRAELLYKRSGAGQWPACGRHLYDR
jgi:uncharacterized protein YabE (DUF348 family)